MTVRTTSLFPMLSVVELERSVAFYGDLLGGEVSYRFPATGPSVFVVLKLGDSQIGLGLISEPALHGQPLRPASGHRIELCAYVESVEDAVEVLRAAGARVILEPIDQPWGERVAYVADPDGNLVMLTR